MEHTDEKLRSTTEAFILLFQGSPPTGVEAWDVVSISKELYRKPSLVLQNLLSALGQPSSGQKSVLVKRLIEAYIKDQGNDELQKILKEKNISSKGTRTELVARISTLVESTLGELKIKRGKPNIPSVPSPLSASPTVLTMTATVSTSSIASPALTTTTSNETSKPAKRKHHNTKDKKQKGSSAEKKARKGKRAKLAESKGEKQEEKEPEKKVAQSHPPGPGDGATTVKQQLMQLWKMGFEDTEMNRRLLSEHNGKVDAVIAELVKKGVEEEMGTTKKK